MQDLRASSPLSRGHEDKEPAFPRSHDFSVTAFGPEGWAAVAAAMGGRIPHTALSRLPGEASKTVLLLSSIKHNFDFCVCVELYSPLGSGENWVCRRDSP